MHMLPKAAFLSHVNKIIFNKQDIGGTELFCVSI